MTRGRAAPSGARAQRIAAACYLAAALALAGTTLHLLYDAGVPSPLLAVALAGFALLAGFIVLPPLGIAGYLVLAHGSSRYGPLLDGLLEHQILSWACAVLALGMLVHWVRQRECPVIGRAPAVFLLLFLLWSGISLAAAIAANPSWPSYPRHHPLFYAQGLVLFLLATQVLQDTRRGWLLALLLCAIPAIHWLLYPPGAFHLDGDLALLAALALVGATAGVAGAPDRTYKILFALAGASGLAMMLVTRNRGALLAAAAGLLVLWLTSRYKGRALAGFAVVLVAVVLLAYPKAYWERFSALWNPHASHATASLDRDTAQQRLSLWQAGKQMVKDAPWLGVGPGNFPNAVAFYEPGAAGLPAHNSIVSIAAETGVPGLILYLALVSSAVIALVRAIRGGQAQERAMRSLLLAAILAFFTGSLVLTRHDAPLFYLLLGWALAATQASAQDRRDSAPAQ